MTQTLLNNTNTSLWRNPAFLVLISTSVLLGTGHKVYSLALPLLVYELTESAQWMGYMSAVGFLPNLFLALFIGVLMDRYNRKTCSMWMIAGQIILLICTFLVLHFNQNTLWILFVLTFLMNTFNYAYHNAKMGIIKQLIPQQQQNLATARFSSVSSFFETIGPMVSGLLLLVVALYWSLLWVAVIYLISLILYQHLSYQASHTSIHKASIFSSLKEAYKVLKLNKAMWQITWLVAVINTSGGMFEIQMIYTAKAIYTFNSFEIGMMFSLAGLGAFFGAMVAPKLRLKFGLGSVLKWSVLIEGASFLIPIFFPTAIAMYITMFMVNAVSICANICVWSYRQESTAQEMIGRVAGITGSLFKLGLPFGLAFSGLIVSSYGINNLLLLCMILQLIAVYFIWNKEAGKLT